MKRLIISVVLFSLVFTGIGYGQGNKPVKSISLDQLLGKKKTEKAVPRFPSCTFVSFEDGGHLMAGHTEEVKKAVSDFISNSGKR